MCGPGFIQADYDKDNPDTWKHWQTAEQKSTEEGRNTNPFYTEDGRYDVLSGRRFDIQTQRGGMWEGEHRYKGRNVSYAMEQIDKEWDHRAELQEIQSRSTPTQVASSGGSGRGYSSGSRSGRGA
jgi:hypothetical protein